MKLNFCTLFDSNYLDKGLVLYESLCTHCPNFNLFIFAFDSRTFNILKEMNLANVEVIGLQDFETEKMLQLKEKRSKAEYCWTCTPLTILYVLEKYNADNCTYVDADMMFFDNPSVLIDEMLENQASVLIVKHNFNKRDAEVAEKKHGKFCVEFNTFLNNPIGLTVLNDWKEKCLAHCSQELVDGKMGDQMYLDDWSSNFKGVHILNNLGGGVAPWNLAQYEVCEGNDEKIKMRTIESDKLFHLNFFHFQNLKYLPFGVINLSSGTKDKVTKKIIYAKYIKKIEKYRKLLAEKFDVTFTSNRTTYKNPIKKFLQKYIRPFKSNNKGDIVKISAYLKEEKR